MRWWQTCMSSRLGPAKDLGSGARRNSIPRDLVGPGLASAIEIEAVVAVVTGRDVRALARLGPAPWDGLRAKLNDERRALLDGQQKRRKGVLSGSFRHRGHLLNGLRAALAEDQRSERIALRQAHALARERLRAQYGRFPNLEQWLRDRGQEVLAEQWRYRQCAAQMPERPASVPERHPRRCTSATCVTGKRGKKLGGKLSIACGRSTAVMLPG